MNNVASNNTTAAARLRLALCDTGAVQRCPSPYHHAAVVARLSAAARGGLATVCNVLHRRPNVLRDETQAEGGQGIGGAGDHPGPCRHTTS